MLPLYDAHNHLQDDWLAPHRAQVVADLRAIGLKGAVVNGTNPADWPAVTALARDYEWALPSYGLHPWHVGNRPADWQKSLQAHLEANPRAAVGEIGLDRWILDRAKPDDPRLAGLRRAPLDEQIEVFTLQLELAAQQNRAVTIHCLDAFGALLDVLKRTPRPKRGFLLHAYGGPAEMVKPFADLGAYFSFNGAFLAERSAARRETFKTIPADRLLVETDAPAMPLPKEQEKFSLPMAPTGERINHPANLVATYEALAALRAITVEKLVEQAEQNFHRFSCQKAYVRRIGKGIRANGAK